MTSLVQIARLFLYLREAQSQGQNRGLRVEAVQHWSGGQSGDSWCMELAWLWLDLFFQGHAPVDRTQSCETFYQYAKTHGWIVAAPLPGDFVLSIDAQGLAHHIGLATGIAPLITIAGNTSADGTSSNGDGCYEHPVNPVGKVFVRVPGVVA